MSRLRSFFSNVFLTFSCALKPFETFDPRRKVQDPKFWKIWVETFLDESIFKTFPIFFLLTCTHRLSSNYPSPQFSYVFQEGWIAWNFEKIWPQKLHSSAERAKKGKRDTKMVSKFKFSNPLISILTNIQSPNLQWAPKGEVQNSKFWKFKMGIKI